MLRFDSYLSVHCLHNFLNFEVYILIKLSIILLPFYLTYLCIHCVNLLSFLSILAPLQESLLSVLSNYALGGGCSQATWLEAARVWEILLCRNRDVLYVLTVPNI